LKNHSMQIKIRRFGALALLLLCILSFCGCGAAEEQTAEIKTLADLNGRSVVIQSGTAYAGLLRENEVLRDVEVLYAASNADAVTMLLSGKADAYVTDAPVAETLTEQYDHLAILEEPVDSVCYGFAFQKGDSRREEFSGVIRSMREDGSLEALREKWLGDDAADKTLPEQTWPGKNGSLDCQLFPGVEPICYPIGTDVTGFDVELILTIAEALDYHVTFTVNKLSETLPSLVAGYTDMVASAVTITEDRAALVDFTEPYMETTSVMLVRSGEIIERQGFLHSLYRVFVENEHWKDLLLGLVRTVLIAVMTIVTGLIFGTLLFLWGYTQHKAAKTVLGVVDWIMTMLPTSTLLLIMYYIVFAGKGTQAFWAAVAAFTVGFGFVVYGSISANIKAIPSGQSEAAYSMGYSRFKALRLILLPQALPNFLRDMESSLVTHVKDTSLAGLITVWDFQAVADVIRAETLDPFIMLALTAVIYMLLAWAGSVLVRRIRISQLFSEKTEEQIRERLKKGKI